MNESNTKKTKLKFSVADFIIIVMLLASFVGIALRYNIVDKLFGDSEAKEMKVSFICEALTDAQTAAFSENKSFYLGDEIFGKISAVSAAPAVIYYENNNGTLSKYESEELSDISGSFICSISENENGAFLNEKTYIASGSELELKSNGVSVTVIITSISDID